MKHIRLPLTEADIAALQAGDEVLLSGPLYTARDAAHQRLCRCLQEGKPLPVELAGETIYYVGPSPAKPGEVIGGAAALLAEAVKKKTPVCYEDLGPEAICRLEVENFYAIVGIDSRGNTIIR